MQSFGDGSYLPQRRLDQASKNIISVARRNARERKRIKHVNSAFDDLRKRVPSGSEYRKISKVETLRSAIEYIKALEEIVEKQKTAYKQSATSVQQYQVVAREESHFHSCWPEQAGEVRNEYYQSHCSVIMDPAKTNLPSKKFMEAGHYVEN